MTCTNDGFVWLSLCAGNQFLKCGIAAACYRVTVAKQRKKRFLPIDENFTRLSISFRSRIIGCYWHKERKGSGACFITLIRVRRIVSGYYFRRGFRDDSAFDNATSVKLWNRL